MKENFEILKGSLAITIKSLNFVANNTGGNIFTTCFIL